MRYLFIVLLMQLSLNARGQSYYKDLPERKATINYPAHSITAQLIPVRGLVTIHTNKMYHWYSSNKISITQGGYSGQLLNGRFTDVYLNKNLKEQGWFDAGLKTGEWKSWNMQGRLLETIIWVKGLPNGKFKRYDEVGKLKEQGTYRRGKLSGKRITFNKDSSLVTYYKDGTINHTPQMTRLISMVFKKPFNKKKDGTGKIKSKAVK